MFAERTDPKGPLPGGEAKLRGLLESIRTRTPDYEDMDPRFATLVARNLLRMHAAAVRFGPIQSVTFLKVLSPGRDIYEVRRAQGTARWKMALRSDGKVFAAVPADYHGEH